MPNEIPVSDWKRDIISNTYLIIFVPVISCSESELSELHKQFSLKYVMILTVLFNIVHMMGSWQTSDLKTDFKKIILYIKDTQIKHKLGTN